MDFGQIKTPGILDRIFYFVTGLGHQAVMIFFVMSGFLVGGSVISGMFPQLCAPRSALRASRWSWANYALRRMTRLWMVLIPALLLTLAWDTLGKHQAPAGYQGAYHVAYNSGPDANKPADLSPATLLGNAVFLQTITANVYGTNGPLWSLANEFWYYLLFPLLLGSLFALYPPSAIRHPRSVWPSAFGAVLLVAALVLLPKDILMGGLVWLMGAAVFTLIQQERVRRWAAHPFWLAFSGLLALGMLAASRFGKLGNHDDLWLGLGCACLVSALAVRPAFLLRSGEKVAEGRMRCVLPTPSGGQWDFVRRRIFATYAKISATASEFSYTLYLVHFPLLAFLFYTVFKGQQMQPGLPAAGWFTAILSGVLLYAAAIYCCFERNTDRLRKRIEPIFLGGGANVPASRP